MNSNGTHSEFTYLERSGGGYERTAWLTEAKVDFNVGVPTPIDISVNAQNTTDSKWKVKEPSGRVSDVNFDWLTYLGTNGTIYKAKVHCEGSHGLDPEKIYTWFEEVSENGRERKGRIKSIEVVDWNGSCWKVEVLDIDGTKGQPQFQLTFLR